MRRKRTAEILLRLTSGLIGTTEIFVLFVLSLAIPLPGVTTKDKLAKVQSDIAKICTAITIQTIKKAFYNLTFHGLVKRASAGDRSRFIITERGREKLANMLPKYRGERPWDGHIYLIYYHLNPKAIDKRERLREFLRSIGCTLIHGGLWLHPYDKTVEIESFLKKKEIPGMVFVSKLTCEGMLGELSLCDMLHSLFNVSTIGQRYSQYIAQYGTKQEVNKFRAAMEYLCILHDDPQLPFPLEPVNFPGKKALSIYQSVIKSV